MLSVLQSAKNRKYVRWMYGRYAYHIVMEQFEAEIELLKAIYAEELESTDAYVGLRVLPQRDLDSLDFVQAQVRVLTHPHLHVTLSQCKGLDPEQVQGLSRTLTTRLQSLEAEHTDSLLYSLFEYSKEALTELNESVAGECMICLEDFGTELRKLARVPGCFHRFHRTCLRKLWLGNWTEAKKKSCEDGPSAHTFKLSCAICRHSVSVDEARRVLM